MRHRFCGYWHTWSRVLRPLDGEHDQVEVNLTPINPFWEGSWEQSKEIHIRVHCTQPGSCGIDTDRLPFAIRRLLIEKLGIRTVRRLLTEDFLSQIDFARYERFSNGGAPLRLIKYDTNDIK